jgi:hypothetical protein
MQGRLEAARNSIRRFLLEPASVVLCLVSSDRKDYHEWIATTLIPIFFFITGGVKWKSLVI